MIGHLKFILYSLAFGYVFALLNSYSNLRLGVFFTPYVSFEQNMKIETANFRLYFKPSLDRMIMKYNTSQHT